MNGPIWHGAAGLALCAGSSAATAGVYSDDLTRCLVDRSTADDRAQMMQWMFVALSASPVTRDMAAVSDARREAVNRGGATLFVRLITDTCRSQSVNALKYEGPLAFETAFNTLGQVAARGLMADPAVIAEVSKLDSYMDKTKLDALGQEAGLPKRGAPATPPAPPMPTRK